jgi:hypothetical protein
MCPAARPGDIWRGLYVVIWIFLISSLKTDKQTTTTRERVKAGSRGGNVPGFVLEAREEGRPAFLEQKVVHPTWELITKTPARDKTRLTL